MNKLNVGLGVIVIVGLLVAPNAMPARDPAPCRGNDLPSKSNGELDNFRSAKAAAVAGKGLTQFNNTEGMLPAAGRNETYYEFDLGQDGFGGRGNHRAVLLVQTANARNNVLASYFTQNHYTSFCRIN